MHELLRKFQILSCRIFSKQVIMRIKIRKKPINVVFLVSNLGMWKSNMLFVRLLSSNFYNPIILPFYDGRESIEAFKITQKHIINFFVDQGFPCVEGYNCKKNIFNRVDSYNPDVVFFQQPYVTKTAQLSLTRLITKALVCYIPYTVLCEKSSRIWNTTLQNVAYKIYYPTYIHKELSKFNMTNRGANLVVVGFSFMEALNSVKFSLDYWKQSDIFIKRIIWAPHHSILQNDILNYSNFLEISDGMIQIAKKYIGKVQFIFKPHPHLRAKLERSDVWGVNKTREYFEEWEKMPNTSYQNDYYADIFKSSDALIHDCSSFSAEYLLTGKPAFYISKDDHMSFMNEFGSLCYNMHYKGSTLSEIEAFIDNVVLDGNDYMKNEREQFVQKVLLPHGNKTCSDVIYDDLNSLL